MTDHSHDNWKPASNPWAVAIVVTGGVYGNSGHHHRQRGAAPRRGVALGQL